MTSNVHAQKGKNPVVMTIDGKQITKDEFLRVYLKNNDNPKYDKESLDEYAVLFKNFKLKVAEAEDLKYDTLPALKRELQGHVEQLAKPYLIDSSKTTALVKEAYDRLKSEISASHILINLAKDAAPEDTLKAYNRAMKVRERILKGESFEDVAAISSDDPSAKSNKGELGFFTAFQMVYPFETAAYNLKKDEISMPVRSNYGYHIIKANDKREARGTITTAHIMVAFSKNPLRSELEAAELKINEVYEQLEKGKSFSKLASLYSDDPGSKNQGGKLPSFGSGSNQRMIAPFEDAAFALKNDGDYSKPFKTDFGYHIVKRLDYKPLGSFNELEAEIKQKINGSDRGSLSEKTFIQKLKVENKYKNKTKKNFKWLEENIDSTVFSKTWEAPAVKNNKWLFQYHKQKYYMDDFLSFIENKKFKTKMPINTMINQYYTEWESKKIMEDEKSRLVDKYPDYKALLQEYHDGVLLYEIMKDKVWDKAIKDTTGLKNFYEENISKYQWTDRADANIFSSTKREMVEEAKMLSAIDTLSTSDILSKVNAESQLNLSVESGKYTVNGELDKLSKTPFKKGANEIFEADGKFYYVHVKELLPAGPKMLHEARGEIIQDYQKHLENNWIKDLNKKYPVVINKDILYSIGE